MLNKDLIKDFWNKRAEVDDSRLATQLSEDGSFMYDKKLVEIYLNKGDVMLDLGCGTGTLINEVKEIADYIVGVERENKLASRVVKRKNIDVVIQDVLQFESEQKFDLITVIGVINYLDDQELNMLLTNIQKLLKSNGKIIFKQQSGVKETVVINNYSEELKTEYSAIYRHWQKEKNIFENYFTVEEIIDVYPEENNKWDNTHHFAYILSNNKEKVEKEYHFNDYGEFRGTRSLEKLIKNEKL
ncbi:TPA: class I SAM-dependent methyltransferase [Staphylococcus pseudintermedius]|nr:class I SAM-dependent methyltransferase [Staphylococcus pseudintermedius]EJD8521220.1 class I SAM-dependent methyltransferase [Staphylococcus pseudintermedius]HAR6574033.1 class I SAM-dependent methyltransferase [Staphylococcus pseudintermedius]